ncbi:hypothetical protein AK812_SmicGene39840 [Symbiodinium microadriaticum]|uniref:Uncharacterized protein n=1 Tax=Symbiodinium microadriaticum TaxID=2951 RepID=A0A1Q9CAH8_SYMMI|nr:hypothetical protein AK812_SmicGene39840 [Symbiodinium microadriaticum]
MWTSPLAQLSFKDLSEKGNNEAWELWLLAGWLSFKDLSEKGNNEDAKSLGNNGYTQNAIAPVKLGWVVGGKAVKLGWVVGGKAAVEDAAALAALVFFDDAAFTALVCAFVLTGVLPPARDAVQPEVILLSRLIPLTDVPAA